MRVSTLVLIASFGMSVGSALAQEPASGALSSGVSSQEMVQQAKDALAEMSTIDAQVGKQLDDAEKEGDTETMECIRLRKSKIAALLAVSSLAQKDMNLALSTDQGARAEHEFRKITVAQAKVRQFQAEVQACTGEGAVADSSSSVDAESNLDGDDDTQGLGISDGVVGVDPPGTTPFEY